MSGTKQGTLIAMPKLGESVTEGTLVTWLRQVGDVVEKYEPIVEIVTDKVTAEVPAPVAGKITELIGAEGDVIPVGSPICVIEEGADSDAATAVADTAMTTPAPVPHAAPTPASSAPAQPISNVQGSPAHALSDARARRDEMEMLRIRSSPLVRRLAEEHAINLSSVQGTGIGGRVTKADMLAAIDAKRTAERIVVPQPQAEAQPLHLPTTAPVPAPFVAAPMPTPASATVDVWPGDEVIDASIMRRQIADHMVHSVQTAPHVTVWMEADMSAVVRAREMNKEEFQRREGFSLTFFPFLVRVVTQALRRYPDLNAVWDNGRIIRRKALNIGVAVALEDGLIVPVLRNADEKNIVGIARAVNDLASRARSNQLRPEDVQGGTFTLNNPGTLGSLFSTPIIVQPQVAILSMEAIVKRPVVIDDAIAIRPMMNLSLSIDHRILDGLAATRFLAAVKHGLETYPTDGGIY